MTDISAVLPKGSIGGKEIGEEWGKGDRRGARERRKSYLSVGSLLVTGKF